MSDNSSAGGGIGFFGAICLVFITLKLCNIIAWSWWWVLSPLWLPITLIIIGVIIYTIVKSYNKTSKRRKSNTTYIKDKPENQTESKWQQRLSEMQKNQEKIRNNRNQ